MVGNLVGTALATAAAAVAVAGQVAGTTSRGAGTVSPFGGPVPIHLVRIGHIEFDLGRASASALVRVGCAGSAGAGTRCFVAR